MRIELRLRRYLDDELVDTRALTGELAEILSARDADWADMAGAAGCRWRVEVDDPTGELELHLVIEGGGTP